MSLYLKIILIIFALAYLISPVDIIPDILLPYIGWIDDGVVLATVIYIIKNGRLPSFAFMRKKKASFQQTGSARHFQEKKRAKDRNRASADTKPENNNNSKRNFKSVRSPYEILGVDPTASKKEIQLAYKEAIKKYHPDKLAHLGEDFSNLANKKFLEIQQAYDTLMKKF